MSDSDPADDVLEELRDQWANEEETFDRIITAILGMSEYTHYPEVAEIANCSENTAKKHLDRLVNLGIVQREPELELARYRRNEAYFEWRAISRIAKDLSTTEIINKVEQLEDRREEFENKFGSTNPAVVSVFDAESDDAIHERMRTVGEWRSIERQLQMYEVAGRVSQNNGRLVQDYRQ
jgi:predicted transcriptional regulator